MPFTITSTTQPSMQPDDESLRIRICGLPEDIQFLILSTFATLNFDNLKCVVSLNSRIHTIFRMRLFHSLKLIGDDSSTFLQSSIPNNDAEAETRYTRFRAICGSTRRLTLVESEMTMAVAVVISSPLVPHLFGHVERLILRGENGGNVSLKEWQNPISTILSHIKPKRICFNLGISFSKTWQAFLRNLSVQGGLDGIEELIQHGVPLSNLEVKLLILDDVEVQRFYLADYIIPSVGQKTLKVIMVRCLPQESRVGNIYVATTTGVESERRLPKEIHIYAHWPGSHGLPLELANSDDQDMQELRRVTRLHQVAEKSICGRCGE